MTITDPLGAGRDTMLTITWPGGDDRGRPVPRGRYQMRATMAAELLSAKQLWTDWKPITVTL